MNDKHKVCEISPLKEPVMFYSGHNVRQNVVQTSDNIFYKLIIFFRLLRHQPQFMLDLRV